MILNLHEDMHVHSTFSDGKHSIRENLEQAVQIGLKRFGCVDHVRADTAWLATYTATINDMRAEFESLRIYAGVEAKFLNADGLLDVPADLSGVDYIYAADHQFPLPDGPRDPKVIRQELQEGKWSAEQLVEMLVQATAGTVKRYERVVVAHWLSILPKIGLTEDVVSDELVRSVASTCRDNGAVIEVDERWRCPSQRVTSIFREAGVPVWVSSDSHRRETIGVYRYVQAMAMELNSPFKLGAS